MVKIIKRYPNRKLYDTQSSCYITLDAIEDMVRQGESLRIVDNSTKEDITHQTLAHIVFEQEKANAAVLPLSMLRGIIESGEDFLQRFQAPMTQFKDEFRRRAEALEESGRSVQKFVDSTQRSIDDMQRRMDGRMRDAVEQLTHIPQMRREMSEMQERIEELEAITLRMQRHVKSLERPRRTALTHDPFKELP